MSVVVTSRSWLLPLPLLAATCSGLRDECDERVWRVMRVIVSYNVKGKRNEGNDAFVHLCL